MIPSLKNYTLRMPESFGLEIQDLTERLNAAEAGPVVPIRPAGLLREIIRAGVKRYEDKLRRLELKAGRSADLTS